MVNKQPPPPTIAAPQMTSNTLTNLSQKYLLQLNQTGGGGSSQLQLSHRGKVQNTTTGGILAAGSCSPPPKGLSSRSSIINNDLQQQRQAMNRTTGEGSLTVEVKGISPILSQPIMDDLDNFFKIPKIVLPQPGRPSNDEERTHSLERCKTEQSLSNLYLQL